MLFRSPEGWVKGRINKAWNKGLSAETDVRVKLNIKNSSKARKKKKIIPWNKGLSAETDERLLKQSIKIKENIKNRKILPGKPPGIPKGFLYAIDSNQNKILISCEEFKKRDDLISAANINKRKGYRYEIILCPHCGSKGGKNVMKRHHFDNCEKNRDKSKKK